MFPVFELRDFRHDPLPVVESLHDRLALCARESIE